jgi:hypothetical protein
MSEQQISSAKRIGILSAMEDVNDAALRFLILHLNVVQNGFEFEFVLYDPDDPLLTVLRDSRPVDREAVRRELNAFYDRSVHLLASVAAGFGTAESVPDYFVVLTTARFSDKYYSLRQHGVSVIALGNWRRRMSPPSILEFILTLTIREAVSARSAGLSGSTHLGTKGCLCDVTPSLADVRQKVLSSFLCRFCRARLVDDGQADLIPHIEKMLAKTWLGSSADPSSPAGIVSALGHDLFIVKGLRPTVWESLRSTLRQDGAKQLLTLAQAVATALIIALLLLIFGLRGGG